MPTGERKDPYRGYNFKLEIDGISRNGFRECAGVDATSDPIDYREGNEKVYTNRKHHRRQRSVGMATENHRWKDRAEERFDRFDG